MAKIILDVDGGFGVNKLKSNGRIMFDVSSAIKYDNYSMKKSTGWYNTHDINYYGNYGLPDYDDISYTHLINNESDKILFVYEFHTNSRTEAKQVYCNNINLTKIFDNTQLYPLNSWPQHICSLWYMVNPPTGTTTIRTRYQVEIVVGNGTENIGNIWIGSIDYYNVNQSNPFENIYFENNLSNDGDPLEVNPQTCNSYVSGSTDWIVGCNVYMSDASINYFDSPIIKRSDITPSGQIFFDSDRKMNSGNYTVTSHSNSAQESWMFAIPLRSS